MLLNILHLDDAFKSQPRFMSACAELNANQVDARREGSLIRLWGREKNIKRLRAHLQANLSRDTLADNSHSPIVTFMGSGDFHHVSALLVDLVSEADPLPLTVIHFDNHPDWVKFSGGMHCGSWVNRALRLHHVERVVTIGPCSRDLVRPQFKGANLKALQQGRIHMLPWTSPSGRFRRFEMGSLNEDALGQHLRSLVKTRNIYITIDKDVLTHKDAITNWDQGKMPLSYLLNTLRFLRDRYHVIGIDINGDYSPKHYTGYKPHVIMKKLESMLDQPRLGKRLADAAEINQNTNLAILNCIREAA